MQYTLCNDSKFEASLIKVDEPYNEGLKDLLFHSKQGNSFPLYNQYYNSYEKYILHFVEKFNNKLRELYPFEYCKSSALLSLKDPLMQHYLKKFPQKQYRLENAQLFLKPACCANHFKIWSQKGTYVKKKQIIHEVADVYRMENEGTVRGLVRGNYFTIIDYHFTTVMEDYKKDFVVIRKNLQCFYDQLLGCNWSENFVQIIRINQDKYEQYKPFMDQLSQGAAPSKFFVEVLKNSNSQCCQYYHLKYELSYIGKGHPFTLGTIQIDFEYPEYFLLDKSKYGLKPTLHFSQGSINRVVQVLIGRKDVPQRALKVYVLGQDMEAKKQKIRDLNLEQSLLWDDSSKNLSQALSYDKLNQFFYSTILVYGDRDHLQGTYTLITRSNNKEQRKQLVLSELQLKKYLNASKIMRGPQEYYVTTL